MLLLLLAHASAATLTELPPWLRGDVGLSWRYDRLSGPLQERAPGAEPVEVGERILEEHRLEYAALFSVGPGVALRVALPHYAQQSVRFPASTSMVYDPATGSGTSVGTDPLAADLEVRGTGLGGARLGLAATPYSESFPGRGNRASWRIDAGVQLGDRTSFWTVEGEQRGAGPGAPALELSSAFSTRSGPAEPYIYAGITRRLVQEEVQLTTPGGVNGTVAVRPASAGRVRVGAELLAARGKEGGADAARFDLHFGVDYRSWSEIPSGFLLADVLAVTEGTTVQESERLEYGGGAGLIVQPHPLVRLALRGDLGWSPPWRVESPYPVYTSPETLHVEAGADLTVMVR